MLIVNVFIFSAAQVRGGPPRGGHRGIAPRGQGVRGGRSSEPLKFDTDFDFETSNAQFDKDDIEKELKNLSLSELHILILLPLFEHVFITLIPLGTLLCFFHLLV